MDVLVEVHEEQELEKLDFDIVRLVGINNRNLKTFDVDVSTSLRLKNIFLQARSSSVPWRLRRAIRAGSSGASVGSPPVITTPSAQCLRKRTAACSRCSQAGRPGARRGTRCGSSHTGNYSRLKRISPRAGPGSPQVLAV